MLPLLTHTGLQSLSDSHVGTVKLSLTNANELLIANVISNHKHNLALTKKLILPNQKPDDLVTFPQKIVQP